MRDGWTHPRDARPVADAPAADGGALAKAWLLALLARAPLAEADLVPTGELAREAPALCGALLAALGEDAALERLRPGGDLAPLAARTGALAGARDAAAAAAAVDVLRTVLWSVLREALPADPDPRLVADLAERVALVGATVLAATLAAGERLAPSFAPPPLDGADAPSSGGDDGEAAAAPSGEEGEAHVAPASAPPVAEAPFLVHDARGAEREPWLRPVDFALARHARSGAPFAVLLADLDEVERLVAAEVGEELAMAVHHVERAVREQLRGEDALVRERIGRYWIVAAGLDVASGRDLAQRIADAVGQSTVLHGAPLTVSVGMAVCPEDGADSAALTARADEGVFAARAAGLHLV